MSWWHVVSPCAGRTAGPVQVLLKDQGSEMLNYLGLKLRKEKHNYSSIVKISLFVEDLSSEETREVGQAKPMKGCK